MSLDTGKAKESRKLGGIDQSVKISSEALLLTTQMFRSIISGAFLPRKPRSKKG